MQLITVNNYITFINSVEGDAVYTFVDLLSVNKITPILLWTDFCVILCNPHLGSRIGFFNCWDLSEVCNLVSANLTYSYSWIS